MRNYIDHTSPTIIKKMNSKMLTYPLKLLEGPYTKAC